MVPTVSGKLISRNGKSLETVWRNFSLSSVAAGSAGFWGVRHSGVHSLPWPGFLSIPLTKDKQQLVQLLAIDCLEPSISL